MLGWIWVVLIVISILLLCNVIKVPELQVNSAATLIISIILPLGVTGISTLVALLLKVDEEKIYKRLLRNNKEKE